MEERSVCEAATLSSGLDHFTYFFRDIGGLPIIHPKAQGPKYDEALAYWKEVRYDGRRGTRMVRAHMQFEICL